LKGGKMKRKLFISLALLLIIPGLLFFISCAKQTVKTDTTVMGEPVEEPAEEKAVEAPAQEEQAQEVASQVTEEATEEAAEEAAEAAEEAAEEAAKEPVEDSSSVMGEPITETDSEEVSDDEEAKLEEIAARNRFIYEDIYFEFDKSNLLPMAQDTLRKKGEYLFSHPDITVVIEGHCDERGTNEYNLALGDRRAESTKRFLVDYGVLPIRLTTVSYGEERPLDPSHNREAWAKNRRAHFVIE